MSIMGNGFYRDYEKYDVEPDYVKLERYDYCEDFREQAGCAPKHWLSKLSKKIFSFML